jgi:hypothetical protein
MSSPNTRLLTYLRRFLFIVAVVTTVLSTVFISFNAGSVFSRAPTSEEMTARALKGLNDVNLVELRSDVFALESDIKALTALPPNLAVRANVERLDRRMDALTERMRTFETLITDEPIEVLRTANLEREIDESRTHTERLEGEMNRLYGQNGVLIGLVVTMMLTLLGVMGASYLKPR